MDVLHRFGYNDCGFTTPHKVCIRIEAGAGIIELLWHFELCSDRYIPASA